MSPSHQDKMQANVSVNYRYVHMYTSQATEICTQHVEGGGDGGGVLNLPVVG